MSKTLIAALSRLLRIEIISGALALIGATSALWGQQSPNSQLHSEARITFENGIRKSDWLNVKFRQNVLPLAVGVRTATLAQMSVTFPNVGTFFESLEKEYGAIAFYKKIPHAMWGEVWRTNKRTGEQVRIHDMSQLFAVQFPQPVPIDSIIAELEKLPDVEYAYGPVQTTSFVQPNDPCYNNYTNCESGAPVSDQWNLKRIQAEKAWDINQGSSNIVVGIIDSGPFNRNHPDLDSKFTLNGDLDSTPLGLQHGTQVAGVVAAETNNAQGIASLGWDLKIGSYGFSDGIFEEIQGPNSVEYEIERATTDGVDIINCSFGTYELVAPNCKKSKPYPGVEQAIANAITQGIIVAAATGNANDNQPGPCDQYFPYTPYPASYQDVIGVTATDLNDNHPTGYNYEGDDSGQFIEIAAPGWEVPTTSASGYGSPNGTSFASPHVAALVGLMLSINSTLDKITVRDILINTAEKVGQYAYVNGRNKYLGNGRINAYQALLLTHAYSTKSMSSSATAFNSGRRVIKDGSNKYHVVFESGITSSGNVLAGIFYRNHNGVSWSAPARLSAGNEQNRYPSIAGNGANLYATWQRKNGSTHDGYFHKSTSGGAAWTSTNRQVRATSVGASDPLPVIASPAANELMLAYRSGNNLAWQRSTNNGSTWSTIDSLTGTALNSPSLCAAKAPWSTTIAALAYATNVIPNASNIIARYFNSPSWSQEHNMSSGLPGNISQHARPSIAPNGDGTTNLVHIAWDAYDSQYAARVIIHKAMSTWNVPSSYYEFHNIDEDQPSITGLAGSKAAMVFRRGANNFFIGSYDASSWSIQFPAVAGKYPSFSLGGTQAKHFITSGSAAPYQVTLSSSTYSKANALTAADKSEGYHRAVGVIDTTTGAWLNVRVENFLVKHKDGSYSFVDFVPTPADTLALSSDEACAALTSDDFVLPVDAESLLVEVSIAGEKAARLGNASNPLSLEFKAETTKGQPSTKRFSALTFVSNEKFNQARLRLSVDLSGLNPNDPLAFKTTMANRANRRSIVASLGHIYQFEDSTGSARPKRLTEHTPEAPKHFVLEQNYPNPFNPETTISYALPYATQVQLVILNTLGQEVARLVDGWQAAGRHRVTWKATEQASGIYFYRIKAGEFEEMKKMSLVR